MKKRTLVLSTLAVGILTAICAILVFTIKDRNEGLLAGSIGNKDVSGYLDVESCDGKECKGTFVESQHEDEAFPVTIGNVRLVTKRVYKNGDHIPAYSTDKLDAICQNFSCYAMPENKNNLVYLDE